MEKCGLVLGKSPSVIRGNVRVIGVINSKTMVEINKYRRGGVFEKANCVHQGGFQESLKHPICLFACRACNLPFCVLISTLCNGICLFACHSFKGNNQSAFSLKTNSFDYEIDNHLIGMIV